MLNNLDSDGGIIIIIDDDNNDFFKLKKIVQGPPICQALTTHHILSESRINRGVFSSHALSFIPWEETTNK